MTPQPCTDRRLQHLSVDLSDAPGGDGGMTGYTLCSAPERPVSGDDQSAIDTAYDLHLTGEWVDIAALPPCAECLRVAELLADPDTAPPLHRSPRPGFDSRSTGDGIRGLLETHIATGTTLGQRAAVHLLTFTTVPDQPGFADFVERFSLVWGADGTVEMGQVTDWAAVVGFAAAADVPDRDRQMIAVAASLAGGPPVGLEAAVSFVDDPAAARRVIEAIAIATGHGDRWEVTERPAPAHR
ncbi:hypothetical protein C1I95_01615 [Micromonospora craterilacus]|uniref:Uncharacterized protein n=1 Tax=Micromonospora craterilacus TaxID=1655439 RepID=A0A2W2FHE1_9ACTN|nr:hypothetical protein [Micromonospora craterilacus]PZG24068.1 hypothetical protein C1I95_01615 [Micromonospora craterilacus]